MVQGCKKININLGNDAFGLCMPRNRYVEDYKLIVEQNNSPYFVYNKH